MDKTIDSPSLTSGSRMFFINWKRIIYHVLELYKRSWQIFFPLFAAFVLGAVQTYIFLKDYHYQIQITITLLILAVICLIIGIVAYYYDFKDARYKDRIRENLMSLRFYLNEMKRLLNDLYKGIDYSPANKVPVLEQEITDFISRTISSELPYWNQPLVDYPIIADRIKRRIAMLEYIISQYENLNP